MKISIIVPCYNERETIEQLIQAVRDAPVEDKEIIVVEDCSDDGTQTLLREKLAAAGTKEEILAIFEERPTK